jgi:hypothetical protein
MATIVEVLGTLERLPVTKEMLEVLDGTLILRLSHESVRSCLIGFLGLFPLDNQIGENS